MDYEKKKRTLTNIERERDRERRGENKRMNINNTDKTEKEAINEKKLNYADWSV